MLNPGGAMILDFVGVRTLERGWHYSWVQGWTALQHGVVLVFDAKTLIPYPEHSSLNNKLKITFQILTRHHDKTWRTNKSWNSYIFYLSWVHLPQLFLYLRSDQDVLVEEACCDNAMRSSLRNSLWSSLY